MARRRRRRNPESSRARSMAARKGWRHRKRNPESVSERRRAARAGWRKRRRNPESERRRASAARAGWRHRRHRVHNPFRSHRRRHNPFDVNSLVGDMVPAAIGAGAGIVMDVILAYLPLPATGSFGSSTTLGNFIWKVLGSLGLGWLVSESGNQRAGNLVAIGAITTAFYTSGRTWLAPTFGAHVRGFGGIADFRDFRAFAGRGRMGMLPRARLKRVGAYMRAGRPMGRFGAYMNPGGVLAPAAMPAAHAVMRPNPLKAKQMGAYMGRSMARGMGMGM